MRFLTEVYEVRFLTEVYDGNGAWTLLNIHAERQPAVDEARFHSRTLCANARVTAVGPRGEWIEIEYRNGRRVLDAFETKLATHAEKVAG